MQTKQSQSPTSKSKFKADEEAHPKLFACTKFFILFITSISLTSCNRNTVELESFSPSGEVPQQTSFSFVFNKEIAPPEKLDQWMNEEFIKFEPAISGQFKWTSANTLLFSPSGSLLPEQDYKATITDKVLFNAKLKLILRNCSFI